MDVVKGRVSPELDALAVTAAILNSTLGPAERLIVAEIARNGSHGFPAIADLAHVAGIKYAAASKVVKRLKALKWIDIEERFDGQGNQLPHHYILRRPGATPQDPPPKQGEGTPPETVPLLSLKNSDSESESKPKEKKQEYAAKAAPPATREFQEIALRIIADYGGRNPSAPLLKSARQLVFTHCERVCKEMLDHWGKDHIIGMWRIYMRKQDKLKRPITPSWFFGTNTFQECHSEQTKAEEEIAVGRGPKKFDPYGI